MITHSPPQRKRRRQLKRSRSARQRERLIYKKAGGKRSVIKVKDGFIKVAAATPKIKVADIEFNSKSIAEQIEKGYEAGARLIVLPELCLTGYTCQDLFLLSDTAPAALDGLMRIAEATKNHDIVSAVGLPILFNNKLYNAAAVIKCGEILGIVPKQNLPNYSEFYELRHFNPFSGNTEIRIDGKDVPFGTKLLFSCADEPDFTFGVELCEDLWVPKPPSVSHALNGASIILNLSASDEVISKAEFRRSLIKSQSSKLLCGYVYADAGDGESTTDMVFAGHNIIGECGSILKETKLFENDLIVSEIDVNRISLDRRKMNTFTAEFDKEYRRIYFDAKLEETKLTRRVNPRPFVPSSKSKLFERCEAIFAMQYMGLKKRLEHIGCKNVTLGISGGLDSTLALLVTARAFDRLGLDRRGIKAITMPCFGTTDRTYNNAVRLIKELGAEFIEVDIKESVTLHMRDIGADIDKHDVTYENSQARERTQVLMDYANKVGGIVIGTGDLSELALGWATYNGDHMSMYGVNCSVPKTLVKYLVRYVAENSEDKLKSVLLDILDTPVSPELLPPKDGVISQETEEIVGPYELHDFFLYNYVRRGFNRDKIFRLAKYAFSGEYDDLVIEKWLDVFMRRFKQNQFKRSCIPDGPKVGTVTLSPRGDWRMPSDQA